MGLMLSVLNAERHGDVCIAPGKDIAAVRGLNHAQIGLNETGVAASDYPLVIMKDSNSGQFRLAALFGLKPGANLFVYNDHWQATYLPLAVASAPFYLGGPDRSLCIDESSDLVTTDKGDALFSDDGREGDWLSRIRAMFDYLRDDMHAADLFLRHLVSLNLLRPVAITVEFDNGKEDIIDGLYSISMPQFGALEDSVILDLHHRGYAEKMHVILNSLSQINRIQQLYNLQSEMQILRIAAEMNPH